MGEAKRRAGEIARLREAEQIWRSGLSDEERVIAQLAERLDERLVRGLRFSEGCYHLAFFMTRYLSHHGIHVAPIIGWVNDGTWKGMTSHGWIEFNGRKTDASLTYTTHPAIQPIGALIIHDRIVRPGMANYSYFKNAHPAVSAGLDWMRRVPEWREVLRHKEAEHKRMLEIVVGKQLDEYLAMAPRGTRYEDLARLVA